MILWDSPTICQDWYCMRLGHASKGNSDAHDLTTNTAWTGQVWAVGLSNVAGHYIRNFAISWRPGNEIFFLFSFFLFFKLHNCNAFGFTMFLVTKKSRTCKGRRRVLGPFCCYTVRQYYCLSVSCHWIVPFSFMCDAEWAELLHLTKSGHIVCVWEREREREIPKKKQRERKRWLLFLSWPIHVQ
jgi:hypothetical protein